MQFTYCAYLDMVNLIKEKGFCLSDYHLWNTVENPCILRHDVDFDLKKAFTFAEFEANNSIRSTYFVLVSTNFYNLFTKENRNMLRHIIEFGHEIGLHFDETQYDCNGNIKEIKDRIKYEANVLSEIIKKPVTTVSMHRPSRDILNTNLQLDNIINSYGAVFFHDFKYLSDSRKYWRENPIESIKEYNYEKLHILTHPFWYSDIEIAMNRQIADFISAARVERTDSLNQNFKNLKSIIEL